MPLAIKGGRVKQLPKPTQSLVSSQTRTRPAFPYHLMDLPRPGLSLEELAKVRTDLTRAAKAAKNALDSFIANPAPEAVLAGPAALASAYLQRANGDYAAAMRSDKVTGARDYAQFRASGANSEPISITPSVKELDRSLIRVSRNEG